MSKYITRAGRSASLMLATTLVFGLIAAQESDTVRAVTRTQAVTAAPTAAVSAAATPKRVKALRWAVKHGNGDRYSQRNPQGPNHWDCSGIVTTAYRKAAGINLGRTTYDILGSGKVKRVSRSYAYAHPGTLAFSSRGHVEFVSSSRNMFGAHNSRLRVSYRKWFPANWKFYRVVGAG